MGEHLDNISIIGAGAWGTALAEVLSRAGQSVTLYARDPHLADRINVTRKNANYLPEAKLDPRIRATSDPAEAVRNAHLVLMVTPTQYVRATLGLLLPHLPKAAPIINCAKGIEMKTGLLLSEVTAEALPGYPYGVLSGPTFAAEVAKGLPTAITLATTADGKTGQLWANSIRSRMFRPYLSSDPVGAEIAGALKNVIAIACGIVAGRKLGENAKAAVMTRGMAEIRRMGMQRGAQSETFLGLSGIGDLTLTCNSMTSRNFSLGFELGRGRTLKDVLAARRTVAEGVSTARAVADYAEKHKVDMPICLSVNSILHHQARVDDVITGLLSRDLKNESL